ncbi:MAG: TipAS antibiotic-recognition domain-containing protein [Clostridia bacterium]|nr:TipAS antibiotic-recognition domain-containing protein [Clostridia bacterium]
MNNDYKTEARSRWGNTDAYREHEQKTNNYTKEKWAEANDGLMAIFAEFAACKASGASADSTEAQALVAELQAHITANYYTCTDEILAGLGKMYVVDERFKKNIDKYGEGTAEFASEGIRIYVEKK